MRETHAEAASQRQPAELALEVEPEVAFVRGLFDVGMNEQSLGTGWHRIVWINELAHAIEVTPNHLRRGEAGNRERFQSGVRERHLARARRAGLRVDVVGPRKHRGAGAGA